MRGLFSSIARPRAEITSLPFQKFLELLGGGSEAYTGTYVSQETAMRYSTVLICMRVLSESVASLPCILYRRRKDGGKDRATDHPLYRILHDAPNDWLTPFTYFGGQMVNLGMQGNAYAYVDRNSKGQVIGLTPLNPNPVTIDQAADWSPVYTVTMPDNKRTTLKSAQIHHIVGPMPRGYVGQSMIALAREAIGLGMAAERFGANMYANGVKPSGVLKHPNSIGTEAVESLRQQFKDKYAGLENSSKPLLLEEGMDWVSMSIAPNDAQFLETRKFQRSEVAGIFRVPAHLVNDLEKATFSNIEHQTLDFIVHSLRPWLKLWEQSISKDLLTPSERDEYFVEFLMDDLLRGDTKTRYEAYASAIQNKWLNANEVRAKENLNPRDGGNLYENPAIQVNDPNAKPPAATLAK